MSQFAKGLFVIAVVGSLLGPSSGCGEITPTCADGKKYWGECPKPNVTLAARKCHVVRQDCLTSDGNGNCTSSTPVTFDAIACGETDKGACDQFCVNAGFPTFPYRAPCSSTVVPNATVPKEPAYCNKQTVAQNYDVSCTIQGRECNLSATVGCLSLSSELTTGTFSACESGFIGPGLQVCGNLPDSKGVPLVGLGGSRVTSATIKVHSGSCTTASPLTASDMSYRLPAGTPVPVSVAGQNLTLTTSGGRMVVTYGCDSLHEFCRPLQIKDFWLGVNPITIGGNAFTDVAFTQVGSNPFQDDDTVSVDGPGFRVAATVNGVKVLTYNKPNDAIRFTGALGTAQFTLASTFDLPIRSVGTTAVTNAHVAMNLAGSTFSGSGTPGGVQINCGNNGAIAPFIADTDFSGGAGKTRNNVIDLSGVVNPAPMAVYQSQHYSSPFSYTIPGLAPGSSHVIRLHFAETNPVNNAPNRRTFSVAINGATMISNLDLFATVGMNRAYVKEFTLPANPSGKYVISFTASRDSATISAIEVL